MGIIHEILTGYESIMQRYIKLQPGDNDAAAVAIHALYAERNHAYSQYCPRVAIASAFGGATHCSC